MIALLAAAVVAGCVAGMPLPGGAPMAGGRIADPPGAAGSEARGAAARVDPFERARLGAEPAYLRFRADDTRLAMVIDDRRFTYLEFAEPVPAAAEFFDQDGAPLGHAAAGRVAAVAGIHQGILVRDGERASFASPNPLLAGQPPRPLPDAPEFLEARNRLEARSALAQAMQRALDASRNRGAGAAARPGTAAHGPGTAVVNESAAVAHPIGYPIAAAMAAAPARGGAIGSAAASRMMPFAPLSPPPSVPPPLTLAPLAIANASAVAPERGLIRVFFATASRTIVAPDDGLALLLREAAQADEIHVTGFTDATGSPESNEALARARADAIVQILIRRGIGAERIYSAGIASGGYIGDNQTDRGRALNRRAEVQLFRAGMPLPLGRSAAGREPPPSR
ncbi:MAG: OmpA family protein [Lautropia sp.]